MTEFPNFKRGIKLSDSKINHKREGHRMIKIEKGRRGEGQIKS